MLYRKFDPTAIYADFVKYAEWKAEADAALDALEQWRADPLNAGKSLPVDSKIYGALKAYLVKYFHGKCAYCESEFETVAWGDVEHYRPKRAVSDNPNHPGYYWLAYCEQNLMPSCQLCNQGKGKRNQFPIQGVYATCPADNLSAEKPLLLNPYEETHCGDGVKHFEYEMKVINGDLRPTGWIRPLTPEGIKSEKVYGLNRQTLRKRRRKNQQAAINAIKLALLKPSLGTVYQKRFSPQEEHATAVRAACLGWMAHYKANLP